MCTGAMVTVVRCNHLGDRVTIHAWLVCGFFCVCGCMKSCCCVPDGETPVSVHKGVRCILGNEALEFSGRSEVKLNVSYGVWVGRCLC